MAGLLMSRWQRVIVGSAETVEFTWRSTISTVWGRQAPTFIAYDLDQVGSFFWLQTEIKQNHDPDDDYYAQKTNYGDIFQVGRKTLL